jgi:protease YdgD
MARLMAAVPAEIRARLGDDSCRWAHDLECDDARFGGTGACPDGTDATDCRAMAIGGDNTCRYANDGECDEPGIGTGLCHSGSDLNDCRSVAFLRNRTNNCEHALNGICDEPGIGTGLCRANTDTADCIGRARPPDARDHFFGHDDRIVFRPEAMPWAAVGLIHTSDGGSCTGMLIGARLVATAAHCMLDGAGTTPVKALVFRAGAWGETEAARAYVVAQVVAPDYDPETKPPGQGNGDDWALLTLDRDLGLSVGHVRPYLLGKTELERLAQGERLTVSQAGY